MYIKTAIELIDQLVYKPGFTFSATDHSKRFEGTILLKVNYEAFESGRENAAEGYPEKIKTYATFPIMVGDIQHANELYRRIAGCLMKIEEHEMREFLRVSPTFWAPFHPHAIDGIKLWNHTSDMPDFVFPDLQFGIG